MAFGVGVTLMHGKRGGKCGKTAMLASDMCLEACEERASKTETLDRSRSHLNEYHLPKGVSNGVQLTAWFAARQDVRSAERVAAGQRKVRSDSSACVGFILYPNTEETATWTDARCRKFARDAVRAWVEWAGHEPDAWALHMDEGGPHVHIIDRMLDECGDYNTKATLSPERLDVMHREIPRNLRKRGWDVQDHTTAEERKAMKEAGEPQKPRFETANEYAAWMAAKRAQDKRAMEIDALADELDEQAKAIDERTRVLDAREADLAEREQAAADAIEAADKARREALSVLDEARRLVERVGQIVASVGRVVREFARAKFAGKNQSVVLDAWRSWSAGLGDEDGMTLDEQVDKLMSRANDVPRVIEFRHGGQDAPERPISRARTMTAASVVTVQPQHQHQPQPSKGYEMSL